MSVDYEIESKLEGALGQDWKAEVRAFLDTAMARINDYPGHMPFKPVEGRLVINWLRALMGDPNILPK